MKFTRIIRIPFRLFVLAVFVGTCGLSGCDRDSTATGSRDQTESRPLVPADLKGKAAERAAQPDGRPRSRPHY